MKSERGARFNSHSESEATSNTPHNAMIVIGVDGSETSWDACSWACGESRRLSARIIAVFVSPTSAAPAFAVTATFSPAAGAFLTNEVAGADQAEVLRRHTHKFAAEHDVDLTFVHTRGDVANELLRIAKSNGADLIAVGRSTKIRHHFAGSLGRRLVGSREAPIVVVVP
jgi:nucleotide-binding universal stress UspA family protein